MLLREQALLRQEREEREAKILLHAATETEFEKVRKGLKAVFQPATLVERVERQTSMASLLDQGSFKDLRLRSWCKTKKDHTCVIRK